jgi:pimeloyl-ACP methyl ester carboxylesterase
MTSRAATLALVGFLFLFPGSAELASQVSTSSEPKGCNRPLHLAPGETWTDPSPHQCGFVQVDEVRLHYLDWGGSGEALVLLHGSGGTAHGFDDLASKFTDRFRVLALTRRGHAQSDHPESGYTVEQTTRDLLAFLDAHGIRRAHLVAHSFAGAELTRFATLHPERVLSATYLDALPDWKDTGAAFAQNPMAKPRPPQDFASSLKSRREWLRRTSYGMWSSALEADFRHVRFNPTAVQSLIQDAEPVTPDYTQIRAPVLVIHTTRSLGTQFPWLLEAGADVQDRERAQDWLTEVLNPALLAQVERLRRQRPDARAVVIEGNHWVHISNLEEVTREMRRFLMERGH